MPSPTPATLLHWSLAAQSIVWDAGPEPRFGSFLPPPLAG